MLELRDYQKKAIQEAWSELKKNDEPVLFVSSVGSGKSIMIASIMLTLEQQNKRALCLVNSSELVRNNAETFREQGGNPSIFCASLNKKEFTTHIVFATPQSVISAIKSNHAIADIEFNMIVVDEAHTINHLEHDSVFMRILRHYKQQYTPMRLLGLTGTDFRGSGNDIVGDSCLFKSRVANITTSWLVENNFLAKPTYGITKTEGFDFSSVKMKAGKFVTSELENVVSKKKRLTWEILQEVHKIMQTRNGAFLFCSSKKHCEEALSAIPEGSGFIITGDTPEKERQIILNKARNQEIKYLISVNCLMTGIDVPNFCTTVWLRPTESLVLYVQGIGRSLRLHESKKDALILDYASNLNRHSDIDHLIINEAIQPENPDDPDYCIQCYTCNTMNSIHNRRCRGVINKKRCDHYFEFKECPSCQTQNDIVSRECRSCQAELIDPNAKLSRIKPEQFELKVLEAIYWVAPSQGFPVVNVQYETNGGLVFECHYVKTEKSKNIFYANFVRKHIPNSSEYYMNLYCPLAVNKMITSGKIMTPHTLICKKNEYGRYEIIKKLFHTIE